MSDKFVFRMSRTCFAGQFGCMVCGGWEDNDGVRAEVRDPCGNAHFACLDCVKSGDPDARLREQVAKLEGRVEFLKRMVGLIDLPTAEDWAREVLRDNLETIADHELVAALDLEAERERIGRLSLEELREEYARHERESERARAEECRRRGIDLNESDAPF